MHQEVGDLAAVELGELLDHDRRGLDDLARRASPRPRCPCGRATGSWPSCPRSSASRAGTRSCRVAGCRASAGRCRPSTSRAISSGSSSVRAARRRSARRGRASPKIMKRFHSRGTAERERRGDVQVEEDHPDHRDRPTIGRCRRGSGASGRAELQRGAEVGDQRRARARAAGRRGSPVEAALDRLEPVPAACC